METIDQLNFLKNNGCTVIQGYLYSPPVPEQEIRQLLLVGSIPIRPARMDDLSPHETLGVAPCP